MIAMSIRKVDGFDVTEGPLQGATLLPALVYTETRWMCMGCGTRWCKPGRHLGQFKTCRKCGAGGWLRAVPPT